MIPTLFVSLGCDKNLVDSQQMMQGLAGAKEQYVFTDDENAAEAAVVNTCCFIDSAKEESIGQILSLAELKKTGKLRALVVTGCLAQRYQDEILKDIPEVDAVLGTTAEEKLTQVLDAVLAGKKPEWALIEDASLAVPTGKQLITLGTAYGYLKIAEGCDKNCTYCVIPRVRGHYRSVPMEDLVRQAQDLTQQGVTELILVAEETTLYGIDLYGRKMLSELLRRLCLISGIHWIRILYCYPEEITKDLVEVIKNEEKVLPYLDMPIQHASDRILKLMGRRTSRQELVDTIAMLREEVPGICLRTTLITGFPTETEEEHQELLSFVRNMQFDRLGVFSYSREDRTPAARMKPQVHPSTKKRRRKELMLAQQEIAFEKAKELTGKLLEVTIDGRLADEETDDGKYIYVGRTYQDIPGLDSNIYIESFRDLETGCYLKARVSAADGYDLVGEIVYDEGKET